MARKAKSQKEMMRMPRGGSRLLLPVRRFGSWELYYLDSRVVLLSFSLGAASLVHSRLDASGGIDLVASDVSRLWNFTRGLALLRTWVSHLMLSRVMSLRTPCSCRIRTEPFVVSAHISAFYAYVTSTE